MDQDSHLPFQSIIILRTEGGRQILAFTESLSLAYKKTKKTQASAHSLWWQQLGDLGVNIYPYRSSSVAMVPMEQKTMMHRTWKSQLICKVIQKTLVVKFYYITLTVFIHIFQVVDSNKPANSLMSTSEASKDRGSL